MGQLCIELSGPSRSDFNGIQHSASFAKTNLRLNNHEVAWIPSQMDSLSYPTANLPPVYSSNIDALIA